MYSMQLGRSAVEIANEKADGVLAAALARAREETAALAEEYASTSTTLHTTQASLSACQEQLQAALQSWEEEKQASIEAASIAASSSFQRAELIDENSRILEELIATKMKLATVCCSIDIPFIFVLNIP